MSIFVFDTDMLSLYQHGNATVIQNAIIHLSSGLAVTVISVEEQLSGWYARLRQAKTRIQQADAYARLAANSRMFANWLILDFPEPTILHFEQLRKLKLGVGGNDLRIAAIVLDNAATLVTRNAKDFQRIPGLKIADWSV